MNRSVDHDWCQVSGAQKLPADLGGAESLCATVGQALGTISPKPRAVEVNVVSSFLVSATVTLPDGRRLPAIKVGSSDHPLGRRAIQMLAKSIAAQVARQRSSVS